MWLYIELYKLCLRHYLSIILGIECRDGFRLYCPLLVHVLFSNRHYLFFIADFVNSVYDTHRCWQCWWDPFYICALLTITLQLLDIAYCRSIQSNGQGQWLCKIIPVSLFTMTYLAFIYAVVTCIRPLFWFCMWYPIIALWCHLPKLLTSAKYKVNISYK